MDINILQEVWCLDTVCASAWDFILSYVFLCSTKHPAGFSWRWEDVSTIWGKAACGHDKEWQFRGLGIDKAWFLLFFCICHFLKFLCICCIIDLWKALIDIFLFSGIHFLLSERLTKVHFVASSFAVWLCVWLIEFCLEWHQSQVPASRDTQPLSQVFLILLPLDSAVFWSFEMMGLFAIKKTFTIIITKPVWLGWFCHSVQSLRQRERINLPGWGLMLHAWWIMMSDGITIEMHSSRYCVIGFDTNPHWQLRLWVAASLAWWCLLLRWVSMEIFEVVQNPDTIANT